MPVHIHFVVQPVTAEQRDRHGTGPRLQAAMFEAGVELPIAEVEAFAGRARAAFSRTGTVAA